MRTETPNSPHVEYTESDGYTFLIKFRKPVMGSYYHTYDLPIYIIAPGLKAVRVR